MYSWNTIRSVAGLLLLIPLVHLAFLMSRDTLATLDSAPTAWEKEVQAYETADLDTSLPPEPLVVVGGQWVTKWRGLEDFLAPLPVLKRGLGRATIDDVTFYYSRLIGHYGPSGVVILPDLSEFHLRDNKSPQELTDAIRHLAELNLEHDVTQFIYVFTPLNTPRYPGDSRRIAETTTLLRHWSDQDKGVQLLDANPLLASTTGEPEPYYFHSDGTSLNDYGYLRLSMILKEALVADYSSHYSR